MKGKSLLYSFVLDVNVYFVSKSFLYMLSIWIFPNSCHHHPSPLVLVPPVQIPFKQIGWPFLACTLSSTDCC